MRDTIYLIIDKNGVVGMRKSAYTLKIGQIAVKVNVNLPAALFQSPLLEGNISLTEEQIKDRVVTELEFELKRLKEKGD